MSTPEEMPANDVPAPGQPASGNSASASAGPVQPGGPRLELSVAPIDAVPGQAVTGRAAIANRGDAPCAVALSVAGLDESWASIPERVGPVEPGATLEIPFSVTAPAGHPPSSVIAVLTARGLVGSGTVPEAHADLAISIGDASLVQASLEPPELHGWRTGRLAVVLRNRGRSPAEVKLSGFGSDAKMRLRFRPSTPVLAPGQEIRVKAGISAPHHYTGTPKRRPYGVRIEGRFAPQLVDGVFVQRPVFSARTLKFTALVVVIALWVTAAVVGIAKLDTHLSKSAQAKAASAQPPAGASGAPAGSSGAAAGASNGGGGSAGGVGAHLAGGSTTVRVGGKVTGADPGGVTVTVSPTSLAASSSAGATPVSTHAVLTAATFAVGPARGRTPNGKVFGTMANAGLDASLTAIGGQPTLATKTSPDGAWAINGLAPSGTYLVVFSKPGFSTQKYLLTTTKAGTTLVLNAQMNPGSGYVSGTIEGAHGPLGGVTVTLSDGTVTVSTVTPTVGTGVGTFSLSGLTTPDTYLVTAAKPGYGTETTLVNLAASGYKTGVRLHLTSGVGSISGTVVAASSAVGVGGVTVSATNGSTTETATTTTVGKIGSYLLPNLPIPGTYALTISGTGFVTQTRKVQLSGNAVVGASLTAAGSTVLGFAYGPDKAGLPAAGVILTNGTNTYKTLTQSTTPVGSFQFTDIPAGNYVLTVTDYGYLSSSARVDVGPGAVATRSLILQSAPPQDLKTGTVEGTVVDLFDAQGLSGVPVQIDGTVAATTGSSGTYQIANLSPGVHTLSADFTGFEPASIRVNVPLGGVVFAPQLALPKLDGIAGTVTSATGSGAISGATVQLYESTTTATVPPLVPATTPTTTPGATTTTAAGATTTTSPTTTTSTSTTTTLAGGTTTTTAGGTTTTSSTTTSSTTTTSTTTTSTTTSTTTTLAGATTTSSSSTTTTQPVPGGSTSGSATTNNSGAYALDNIKHGSYQLVVSAPGYVPQKIDVSLAADQSLTENVTLSLEPLFTVVTYAAAGASSTAQIGGVCVTVKGPNYDVTELSDAKSPTTFSPLVSGDTYDVTFWQPSSTAGSGPVAGVPASPCPQDNPEIGTAPSTSFVAAYNNTGVYSAFIAQQLPAISVSLTYQYVEQTPNSTRATTIDCPVVTSGGSGPVGWPSGVTPVPTCPTVSKLPAVSLTGITAYGASQNGSLGAPTYSSPIDATAPAPGSDTWTFAASALSALISGQVTLKIDGSGTPLQTMTPSEDVTGGSGTYAFIMTPNPVTVTGKVTDQAGTVPNGLSVAVNPAIVPVSQYHTGTSQGSVTASTNTSGDLEWGDSQVGAVGLAQPGVYTLTATATGFDSASTGATPITIGVNASNVLDGTAVTIPTLTLDQEVAVSVPVSWPTFSYGGTSLPAPTVALLDSGAAASATNGAAITATDANTGTTTTASALTLTGSGSDTVTFKYLSPNDPNYSLVISQPGVGTYRQAFTLSAADAPAKTLSAVDLSGNAESALDGLVQGEIDQTGGSPAYQKLAGATVTATQNTPGGACGGTYPTTASGTTASDGTFLLTGSPGTGAAAAANGGFCPGSTFDLSVGAVTGYGTATVAPSPSNALAAITTAGAAANNAVTATLKASPMTQQITVQPASGSFSTNGYPSITVTNALGAVFTCGDTTDNPSATTDASNCTSPGAAVFGVTVYPTSYTYTITAPGYQTLTVSGISYGAGTTPNNLSFTLQGQTQTIQGKVTENGMPVGGLKVGLYDAASGTLLTTATAPGLSTNPMVADSTGVYNFTGVPSGSYYVEPDTTSGYELTNGVTDFSTAYPASTTTQNITVIAPAVPLTVKVAVAGSSPDLSGTTVTLTPFTPPGTAPACLQSSHQPLLASSVGTTQSATVSLSGSTYAASFSSVTPDDYYVKVAGTNVPNLSQTEQIAICPTTLSPSAVSTTDTLSYQTPTITGLAVAGGAAQGATAGGTSVTISGTNLAGALSVQFGTTAATSYTVDSDTQITAVSPVGSGTVNVKVTTPGGSATSTGVFTYLGPTVTGVSPNQGPAAGGTSVTITGSGFTNTSTVSFGGAAATAVTFNSATSLTATSPSGTGTVDVTVNDGTYNSPTSANDQFTYQTAPTVTGLSSSSGTAAGGGTITIYGSAFNVGSPSVAFGATPASVVNSTATTIKVTVPAGTGVQDVVVTNNVGPSSTSAADKYAYVPDVTSLSKTEGSESGGDVITVTGDGFTASQTSVAFGNNPAASISYNSSTQLTVKVPASLTSGAVDVLVTTPGGTSPAVSADQYTYDPLPSVTQVSPSSGPSSGNTTVTITGTGFTSGSSVSFGSTAAASLTVNSSTQITAKSPSELGATVDITVTTPGGTSAPSGSDQYTFVDAPIISNISPSAGKTAGGDTVTITGFHLLTTSSVKFGTAAATIQSCSSGSCTVTTPPGSAGSVDVTVTTTGGTATDTSAFTYDAAPTIGSVAPTTGPASGGTSITITGTNLTDATGITVGGTPATSVSCSATSCTATTPAGTAGAADVVVTTPGGTATKTGAFTYVAAPTITGISPTAGPLAAGTLVTINGTHLSTTSSVKFGTASATNVSCTSGSCTVKAPAGSAGSVDVVVTTTGGTATDTAAYTYDAAPTITNISPTSGPTGGGTSVTITGTNLTDTSGITFGGTAGTSLSCSSSTSCTVTTPAGSAGGANVIVTTPGGTAKSTNGFTYVAAPTISSVSPSSGPTGGGTSVTITGTDLSGTTAVTFGGVAATINGSCTSTSCTVTTPGGTAGAVDVAVTTPGGTATKTGGFTYVAAPSISSVSPSSGPTGGGTSVTITGTDFSGATAVTFGGVAATTFSCSSSTTCSATTPAGTAGAVDVSVTATGGTGTKTGGFTYVAPPVVSGISPATGPTGTSVTITGSNLSGGTVKFGTLSAGTCSGATSCTVSAPANTSGTKVDITVTTTGGTSATSSADQYTY